MAEDNGMQTPPWGLIARANVGGATAASIGVIAVAIVSSLRAKWIQYSEEKSTNEVIVPLPLMPAAEMDGNTRTHIAGLQFMAVADYASAHQEFLVAAKQGDRLALCYLGLLYEYGLDVNRSLPTALFA